MGNNSDDQLLIPKSTIESNKQYSDDKMKKLTQDPTRMIASMMWYSPNRPLRSHSLVHSENNSYFVVIGPIRDVELTYIF